MKVFANNWNTDKNDHDFERERAVKVQATDPAHSYQTGETLRAMLTLVAR